MKRLLTLASASALLFSMAACHNAEADKNAATVVAQEATIDSMKMEIAKQRVVDSMQEVAKMEEDKAAPATIVVAPSRRSSGNTSRTTSEYTSSSSNSNAGYSTAPVYQEPAPAPKRGWSAKAKGAVIGAGAGAVGGAIINKRNRGAGAVIGGLGGAAVGTGVGAIIDRKKGR